MPVNDIDLNNYILSMENKITQYTRSLHDMQQMLKIFQRITLDDDDNIKTDPDTLQPYTATRRDEIYDGCIPRVTELLTRHLAPTTSE